MLQINYSQGLFEIEGSLLAENSESLRIHFEALLRRNNKIILNLDKVDKIDSSGINCIVELYKKALRNNKICYAIGKHNKKISKAIKTSRLRYIVRNDFL
jgi:anti-anti-sigma factor